MEKVNNTKETTKSQSTTSVNVKALWIMVSL